MKKESCLREFTRFVSLNVLGMLGLSCYILADTYFISKGLGANGLTALNLALPIYNAIRGLSLMLGMGGAIKFAIYKARGQRDKCSEMFSLSMFLSLFASLLFVLAGLLFSRQITALLGADSDTFAMTNTYLKVILLFSPAFMVNNVLNSYLCNDGRPKLAMLGMLIGSMFNIVFDYIFIFPCHMGILGAVLATGFSPIVGSGIMSVHIFGKHCGFTLRKITPNIKDAAGIAALGTPSFVTEMSSGIVMFIFNTLLLSISGNIGVAAYGITANISLVITAVFTGIAQGLQPVTSAAYGINDTKRVKQSIRYAVITVSMLSAIIYISVFAASDSIAAVFNSEQNARLQAEAVPAMRLYLSGIIFSGFNIVLAVFLSSIEKPLPAQVISLLRGFVLIIPLSFVLAHLFGTAGIWITLPVTEFIVSVTGIIMFFKIKL